MKQCTHCKRWQDNSCFIVTPDGRLESWCRECNRQRIKEYREKHRAEINHKGREHGKANREILRIRERNYQIINNTKSKVRYALRVGKLFKKPCEVCGSLKVEAHHDDYSKPLEVRWLCHFHHIRLHFKEYDKEYEFKH